MGGTTPSSIRFKQECLNLIDLVKRAYHPVDISASDVVNLIMFYADSCIQAQRLDPFEISPQEIKKILCPHLISNVVEPTTERKRPPLPGFKVPKSDATYGETEQERKRA